MRVALQRARDCLGLGLPAAQRSAEQAQRLKTLLAVVHISEGSVLGHLSWATFHFQDIVSQRTGGRNPFGNIGAVYSGSDDDAALNAAVLRYRADPVAAAQFAADTNLQGRIDVPVLSLHAIHDPTAFVELESVFKQTMARGGSADKLVQVFTEHAEHSYLADVVYVSAMAALLDWAERAAKPTPLAVSERCAALEAHLGQGLPHARRVRAIAFELARPGAGQCA